MPGLRFFSLFSWLAQALQSGLQQIEKLLFAQTRLLDDAADRARRKVLAVHGHHHPQLGLLGMAQAVVAALDMVHVEAAAGQRPQHVVPGERRQAPAHTIASLTLTCSVSGAADVSLSGSGRPSFWRLSR